MDKNKTSEQINKIKIDKEKVKSSGGLHIVGTERHESRRIDNQLRGRSGRQGDPGSSIFYISLEDVRKSIVEKYGFEKVYKQGFNIKTPINLKIQTIATQSLREGLIKYDKRKSWRGPLLNKKPSKSWTKGLEKFDLEKSIGWNLAIVKKIDKFFVEIETSQNDKGKIEYQDISWTKKEIIDILKIGDVIYVKKLKTQSITQL